LELNGGVLGGPSWDETSYVGGKEVVGEAGHEEAVGYDGPEEFHVWVRQSYGAVGEGVGVCWSVLFWYEREVVAEEGWWYALSVEYGVKVTEKADLEFGAVHEGADSGRWEGRVAGVPLFLFDDADEFVYGD
jgi:hypothetical protein